MRSIVVVYVRFQHLIISVITLDLKNAVPSLCDRIVVKGERGMQERDGEKEDEQR